MGRREATAWKVLVPSGQRRNALQIPLLLEPPEASAHLRVPRMYIRHKGKPQAVWGPRLLHKGRC